MNSISALNTPSGVDMPSTETSLGVTQSAGVQNTLTASLQRDKTPHSNKCPRYDIKQSDGNAKYPLLPSLPGHSGPEISTW